METIYLNNAGTSWPKPPSVIEAAHAALAAPPEASRQVLRTAHAEVCRALGIKQPERLLLTGSCTAALALVIGDFPLQHGDVVLTSALEHHALLRPLQQLVLQRGIVLETSPYAPGRPFDLDFARKLMRGGQVRLVAVSGASNVTGELLPVDELGRLAHEYGVPLLLDAAQTMGVVPIDVGAMAVDMLVFAGHKGPLAPHGVGGLWVAPHVVLQSPAAVCTIAAAAGDAGMHGHALVQRATPHCASFPGDCDVGSMNLAAAAGLAAALSWRREQKDDVFGEALRLRAQLEQALRDIASCTVLGGQHVPHSAALSLLMRDLPLARAEAHFAKRGIAVRAGQHCAPSALQAIGAPEGTVRVSFGPFNQHSDIDAIVEAIVDAD